MAELVNCAGPNTYRRLVALLLINGSNTSDEDKILALEVFGNRKKRGSGATVLDVKPATELPGTTSRFLDVSSNFDVHVGNALAAEKSAFFAKAGAKQRTARNETTFDELAPEADAGNVATTIKPTAARLNAIGEISRCFMSPR
jgi:hypothetical protein